MTPNQNRISTIMRDSLNSIDEKCEGYRVKLENAIQEILALENSHRVSTIDIQKQINGTLNRSAQFLVEQLSRKIGTEEQPP